MSRCAHCHQDNATHHITGGTTYQAHTCTTCKPTIRRQAARAGPTTETPLTTNNTTQQTQLF